MFVSINDGKLHEKKDFEHRPIPIFKFHGGDVVSLISDAIPCDGVEFIIVERYVHSGFLSGDYSNEHSNRYVLVGDAHGSKHALERYLTFKRRLTKEEALTHSSWQVRQLVGTYL